MTKQPPFLKPGARIGITCPSGYLPEEKTLHAKKVLESWGFEVMMGATVGTSYCYFSGTDEERQKDLQSMLDDNSLDAILMGRGGYGLSRIVDDLDFSKFVKSPKWICGFSDITVLHSHILSRYNIATLHSPMCAAFTPETENEPYLLSLKNAWLGMPMNYRFSATAISRPGQCKGVLTGGNLAMLAHLTGSISAVNMEGKILFIEDVGEYYYHVDRLMLNLKRAGVLAKLSGLVVGTFSDMQDTDRPFGQTVEELIFDKIKEFEYPVSFGFPAGHDTLNFTLKMGAEHNLSVGEGEMSLQEADLQILG